MPFESLALLCAISAAAAFLICAFGHPIARTMALLDMPDTKRKRHKRVTPLVGGLAAFPGVALACVEAVSEGVPDDAMAVMYGVVFGFFMIGYADDRVQIRPSRRLLMTLALFAGLILMAPGFMVPNFTFGSVALPLGAGMIAMLGIVGSSGALNAINMADGQNGLCIGLFLIWLSLLMTAHDTPYAAAATVAASGLIVVLFFNLATRVFLGDHGAYGIGSFVLALMLAGVAGGVIDHGQIVAALTVPVVDCVWLMIERKRRGHSPYDPDRQHLHHILQLSFGQTISLLLYLGVVAAGSAAALFGGWACTIAIVAQAAFVVAARTYLPRQPEPDEPPKAAVPA